MTKKLAIPVRKNSFCPHFGESEAFAIFEISQNQVYSEEYVTPPPHKPGVFPLFLSEQGVTHVLVGGLGRRAMTHFQHLGITPIVGVDHKTINELVQDFINDKLVSDINQCHQ